MENKFIRVDEVADELGVSRPYAYKLIRQLNEELKGNRTIKMPNFLCDEMRDYLGMLYGVKKKDRIFTVTKSYLHHEMDRGAKEAGVKRIRIHDGCIKIGLNQKQPHSKGGTDLVPFLFYNHKGGNK